MGGSQGLRLLFDAPGRWIDQPPAGMLVNRRNMRDVKRVVEGIESNLPVDDVHRIQARSMSHRLDTMTASRVEFSQFLQHRAGVHKRAANEISEIIIQLRRAHSRSNRDFTTGDLAKLLEDMRVPMPEGAL
ncbi:hypothetical protein DWV00_26630 [Trinickia dinghuensis]|uniref:Uncharacterized protein n=1 Tax=Trinickia dinghuensis TaxID=2291023 RepID=A0A3D8JST4_9BURK|nr:hypothetical protein DWV00_26630 [Trinickia dinghuensis]